MKTKLLKKLRKSSKKYIQIIQVYDLNIKKYIIRHKENTIDTPYSFLHVTKSNYSEFVKCCLSILNADDFHYKIRYITTYTNFNDAFKKLEECRRNWISEEIEKMRNKLPIIKVFDV
jgi:hypothetical protein